MGKAEHFRCSSWGLGAKDPKGLAESNPWIERFVNYNKCAFTYE